MRTGRPRHGPRGQSFLRRPACWPLLVPVSIPAVRSVIHMEGRADKLPGSLGFNPTTHNPQPTTRNPQPASFGAVAGLQQSVAT